MAARWIPAWAYTGSPTITSPCALALSFPEKIFERFQCHNHVNAAERYGIGLAICKKTIEDSQWKISNHQWFYSCLPYNYQTQ
jgi:light-regulated signal transduction histidine kinase (bacteriophytochrome)